MPNTDTLVTVTGASGFIALHCIQQLLEEGYRVRGTVRSLKREADVRAALKGSALDRLELCEADLVGDDGWPEALEGATYALHVASPFPKATPKTEKELIEPALDGTMRVLRAAAEAGVKRVVQTSSIVAVAMRQVPRGHVFTEADWTDTSAVDPYAKSKTLAERAAWELIESGEAGGMELVAVNPGYVLGPSLSGAENTSNEVVNKLLRREVPGVPRLHLAVVDVRDVAKAHLLAMTTPEAAGKRFLLVSESVWYRDLARTLADAGYHVPTRVLPNVLVKLVAIFDPTVRAILPTLEVEFHFSNRRAVEVLGWEPRPMPEMVLDTARQAKPGVESRR